MKLEQKVNKNSKTKLKLAMAEELNHNLNAVS
jgi:hypothetical protein